MIDPELIGQEFWLMVCFFVLIVCIYRPVKRYIFSCIDREILRIQNNIDSAHKSRLELDANVKILQKKLKQIIDERPSILSQAQNQADKIALSGAKELELLITQKEQDIVYQIEYLKATALQDIRSNLTKEADSLVKAYLAEYAKDLGGDVAIAKHLLKEKK
ncbi:MAG: hypothetical protein V4485_02735 [Pseudomonadota bacterium]